MLLKKNYYRLIASAKAEQILDNSSIYLDTSLLNAIMQSRSSNEKMKYYNAGKDTGFISTNYYSRDKITARIFTKSNSLNLITLSDRDIKQCMTSRYENGYIVEIDYSSFEYGIMMGLLELEPAKDIHQDVATQLEIPRDEAKRINNAYFYGMSRENLRDLIDDDEKYMDFLKYYTLFDAKRQHYIHWMMDTQYVDHNYVINPYGRFIYPKSKHNIFNNIIQSTGSDILIDVIHNINATGEFNLLFHRFDSLFFDISKHELYPKLKKLVNIMVAPQPDEHKLDLDLNLDYNLNVEIALGRNLNNLKKLK